jgi:hypothetical protein
MLAASFRGHPIGTPRESSGDPTATPIHELERHMRCKDCSRIRGYPHKRSHLVALRSDFRE